MSHDRLLTGIDVTQENDVDVLLAVDFLEDLISNLSGLLLCNQIGLPGLCLLLCLLCCLGGHW